MSKWGVSARVKTLRTELLPKLGAEWRGSDIEFMELLTRAIECLPEQERDVMQRYYIIGETQEKNQNTGRAATADSRFYMLLMSGRSALATLIRAAQSDSIYEPLRRIYG